MARELAARSVSARRQKAAAAKEAAEIKAPKDAAELVTELSKVFADLRSGQLTVAVGRALATLGMVLLRGWEQTAIREELEQLRQMVIERNAPDETDNEDLLLKEENKCGM